MWVFEDYGDSNTWRKIQQLGEEEKSKKWVTHLGFLNRFKKATLEFFLTPFFYVHVPFDLIFVFLLKTESRFGCSLFMINKNHILFMFLCF